MIAAEISSVRQPDTWTWRCTLCGWRGVDLPSMDAAVRESERHHADEHDCEPTRTVEKVTARSLRRTS